MVYFDASALAKGLLTEGRIALYGVFFDSGKAAAWMAKQMSEAGFSDGEIEMAVSVEVAYRHGGRRISGADG